jgi:hypothetical protein
VRGVLNSGGLSGVENHGPARTWSSSALAWVPAAEVGCFPEPPLELPSSTSLVTGLKRSPILGLPLFSGRSRFLTYNYTSRTEERKEILHPEPAIMAEGNDK